MHWRCIQGTSSRWRKRQPEKLSCRQWRVWPTARWDNRWRLNGRSVDQERRRRVWARGISICITKIFGQGWGRRQHCTFLPSCRLMTKWNLVAVCHTVWTYVGRSQNIWGRCGPAPWIGILHDNLEIHSSPRDIMLNLIIIGQMVRAYVWRFAWKKSTPHILPFKGHWNQHG